MPRLDRISELHRILHCRRTPIPFADLLERMGCSESTLRRAIATLRDVVGAPLVYDPRTNGWLYDCRDGESFELPGLWFTAAELHALLAARQLLADVGHGLLGEDVAPLAARIERILGERGLGAPHGGRVRLRAAGIREVSQPAFGTVCEAVLARRRLAFRYRRRDDGAPRDRQVSPQRLTWWRGNWYLEAWDEEAAALRRFAVERIDQPRLRPEPIHEISESDLGAWSDRAYGIFAGPPVATAVLRFTPERARWVADEQWHPDQQTRWLADGRYELCVPYADPREIVLDILRYGPDVEVVAPAALRDEVYRRLVAAVERYQRDTETQTVAG